MRFVESTKSSLRHHTYHRLFQCARVRVCTCVCVRVCPCMCVLTVSSQHTHTAGLYSIGVRHGEAVIIVINHLLSFRIYAAHAHIHEHENLFTCFSSRRTLHAHTHRRAHYSIGAFDRRKPVSRRVAFIYFLNTHTSARMFLSTSHTHTHRVYSIIGAIDMEAIFVVIMSLSFHS